MPHIARVVNDLHQYGAYVDIIVFPESSIYHDHKTKGTVCPAFNIPLCLIDTGASNSCIDQAIALELGLIARDQRMVGNANGQAQHFLYDVGYKLPIPTIPVIPLQVFGADLSKQPYKALLGRDILKLCVLVFSGATNSWTLSI